MIRKRIVGTTFLLSFLLSVAMIGLGEAQTVAKFGVDPQLTIGLGPGNVFDVYVTAWGVTDLFLAEYFMSFNPVVLNVVDDPITFDIEGINVGDTPPYFENILIESLDNASGWLKIVSGRPIGVKDGLSGDVQTCKITFEVMAQGSSGLDLYDFRLKDVAGTDMEINMIADGFFASEAQASNYVFASNSTGALQNVFGVGETVYAVGGGFDGPRDVDIYVVPNATWADGDPIGSSVLPVVTVALSRKGDLPHLKMFLPITALGIPTPADYYDIVVDWDQDGIYDAATDGVDDVGGMPGFTGSGVPPVPEFPFGITMIMLLAPIIPLAYLWRLRKKVTKQ